MQNNTNNLEQILTMLDNLPEGSSGNPTQDFFVDYTGIYSIDLNGGLTKLNISDLPYLADEAFMEWCRNDLFHMGGTGMQNQPVSNNPGRQGARGRFIFGEFNESVHHNLYMYFDGNIGDAYNIDSMIVECIGGPNTSPAECTMIADVYTVDVSHYRLQICCKDGAYNTNSWETVTYGYFASTDNDNTFAGENDFQGNVLLSGPVADYGGNYGTEGQILSSTGDGVKWIDAPSGNGGSGGLTLYSTWTGEINVGGYAMSIDPDPNDTYILEIAYENGTGEITWGRCLFKASNVEDAQDWGYIRFRNIQTGSYFVGNYTWSKSIEAPSPYGIYSEYEDTTILEYSVVAVNLYKLN